MSRNPTAALVDDLRARTVDGRVAPGGRLPGEDSPTAEHGVRRTAAREAVARAHDVRVPPLRGRGRRPGEPHDRPERRPSAA